MVDKGRTKKHGNFILSKNNFDYADPFILNNRYILFEIKSSEK